jgi:hypothetical protein
LKVSWLIETDLFPEYAESLLAALRAQGHVAKAVPELLIQYRWQDVGCSYRSLFAEGECVVFHGSIGIASELQADNPWRPGVWFSRENYNCSTYYCHFAKFLLNSDYVMLPFGELRRRRDFLFQLFGADGSIFVRPDSVAKSFTGQLAHFASFDKDVDFMAFYDVPASALVLVSSPKKVVEEWRFVLADRRVVTGCLYQVQGKKQISSEVNPEALALANEVAASDFQPDKVWTADICRTADGRVWLLEIGSFSCASLYACDVESIARDISRIAEHQWAESAAHGDGQ